MHYIQKFLHFLEPYGTASYWVIFGVLVACGFGFPMPEDVILVTGGILASQNIIDPFVCFIVCMLGVMVGDCSIYFLGHKYFSQIRRMGFVKRILSEERDLKVKKYFHRFGDWIIFIARFLPGLRMPVFLTVGSYHIPFWKFFCLDFFAALISVPVWIWVGFFFGSNMDALEKYFRRAQFSVYGLALLLIGGIVAYYYFKRKTQQKLDEASESN